MLHRFRALLLLSSVLSLTAGCPGEEDCSTRGCPLDMHCDEERNECVFDGPYDCVANGGCPLESGLRCDEETRSCVPVEEDAGTDAGSSGDAGSTDAGTDAGTQIEVEAGDTCAAPGEIPSLPATFTGSTVDQTDDYDHCSTSGGQDVVYRFSLTGTRDVTVRVVPSTPSFRPLVYLRNAANCGASGSVGTAGCIGSIAPGVEVKLVAPALEAGTYFLVIDGMQDSKGDFTVDLRESPVGSTPSNESCGTAEALSFMNGRSVVTGTTQHASSDNANASCFAAASAGPDLVYTFTTPALQSGQTGLNAKALLVSDNADLYSPQLNVRQNCADSTDGGQLLCVGSTSNPLEARGILNELAPSTDYFLIVESASTTKVGGPFTLEVDLAAVPAPNDACAGATELSANTSVMGSTLGGLNDYDQAGRSWYSGGSCSPAPYTYGSADVVYSFTAPATGTATITVKPQRTFDVAVAVFSECVENSCVGLSDKVGSSGTEELSLSVTSGVTYFLVVDSFGDAASTSSSRAGGFTIGVSL